MNQSGTTDRDPHAEGPTPGSFSALLGFRYVSVDEVESVLEADPGPEHCNGGGIVHAGFLASILDTATGWAVHARLPEGTSAPHVHLSIQYVRAGSSGGDAHVPRPMRQRGRTNRLTEAEVTQQGAVVARTIGTHACRAGSLRSRVTVQG